jgi:hypothetical protein
LPAAPPGYPAGRHRRHRADGRTLKLVEGSGALLRRSRAEKEITMQRGSDQHSLREDDELKAEMQGMLAEMQRMLKGNKPTRAEEWREPEPPADDDPGVPPFEDAPR